jgi:hypothetical protein
MMCHAINPNKKRCQFIFPNSVTTPMCNTMSTGTGHMIQNIACNLVGDVNMFIIKLREYSIKYLNINWVRLLMMLPPANLSILYIYI